MFLGRMIRRRLLSLLGPWLLEPPELELKIGIVQSHVIAKNLRFDASALNAILEESSNVFFKELTIENITVRFSNWSVYTLSIEFSGVRVVLSARENKHGSRSSPVDTTYNDLEKELYAMDPEGRVLHDVLRKLCVSMPSSDKTRISIWNLICRHCRLVVHDIKVHLQLPMVNDYILGFWEVEELTVISQYLEQGCILRDCLGMVFAPLRESSFLVSWNDVEIGFRRNDQMSRVLFCKDLLCSSKLKDLQFVDVNLHVPELRISFSPTDMVVCLAFQKALSQKVKHPRNGKQLWKVVARRISTVSSVARFSLHRLVTETTLWLRYVSTYEHLLLLVGYPSSDLLKRSALRMLEDKSFISMLRHQWKVMSDAEKELKPDAILHGRRIARNRLSSEVHVPVGGSRHFFSHHLTLFYKILAGLRFLAKLVYGVHYFILCFVSLGKFGTQGKHTDGSSDLNPKECFLENSFILYFENVSITLSPNKEICLPLNGIGASHASSSTSYSEFRHFCIKFGSLSLKYVDNILEQTFFTSCAKFGMSSALVCSDAVSGTESTSATFTNEGQQNGDSTGLETLIWGEPVQKYSSLVNRETEGPPDMDVGVGQLYLQKFLGELWIYWEATAEKFEERNSSLMENPFLLFETTSSLSYPGPRILDSAFCKCNLMVGRLQLALGYFSTLSISVLLMQIRDAFSLRKDTTKSSLADLASSSMDNLMIDSKVKLGSYSDRMKMVFLEMLPEKNIQLGVFISGPRYKMSFEKDGFGYRKTEMDYNQSHDFQLTFDVHDIELAIWPAVELGLDPPTRSIEHEDMVEKPQTHDISAENDGKYTSEILLSLGLYLRARGIDAYMENLTEKQHTQVLSLSPIAFQLSVYRQYVHSLSGTYVILSAALNGIASGFMAQLYMDVMYDISQEIQGLLTADSVNIAMVSRDCLKESLLQYLEVADPVKENSMLKGPILLDKSTFVMKGTFKLYPMNLVFQYSMNNDAMSNSMKRLDPFKRDKHNVFDCGIWVSIKDASADISCGEGIPNVLICLAQVHLAIINGSKRRSINFLNKMLFQSLSCCYEASVSNTTFALYCDSPVGIMSNRHNVNACNSSASDDSQISSSRSSLGENLLATVEPCLSQWLHINIAVGQVIIGRHSVTDLLLGAHEMRELQLSLSVGGEFQIISARIQGCLFMVEIEAVVMFLGLYTYILQHAKNILHTFRSSNHQIRKEGSAATRIALDYNLSEVNVQDMPSLSNQSGWGRLELLTFDTSAFSVMIAAEEAPGVVRQIMLELEIKLNIELANKRKKIQFDLCRLSVTSQVLCMNMNQQAHIPHFASMTSRGIQESLSKPYGYQDRSGSFENGNTLSHISEDTSTITVVRTGQQNFILSNGGGSIQASLDGSWIGDGSLSGFDMTISLPEIQMILSAVGSFPPASTKENSSNLQSKEQRHWDTNQQADYAEHNLEEIVPDGAIVAIQDVDQHMFFAIDGERDTYSVVGALHYSLVGERAFFQVRYHKEIGWRSTISWFSLMSLHAKDGSGEPLRLTYRRGQGSVDVFSSYDSRSSLFRAVSCKPGNFEGDIGWEPYNQLVKSTFYLVNKKNSCALAFVNGIPTFVKKPGNPFKFRVFQDTYLSHNLSIQTGLSVETSRAENQHESQIAEERSQQRQGHCFPLIKINVEKVSVTVVHELLDEQDRVPLLNFGIADTLLNVQISPAKVRMICTLQAWLDYFDSQRKSWSHLIHPVEVYSYYRNRLSVGTDIVKQGAPGCFYCRAKEVDVSVNEISLDIPLFVIGKLNIAGPYSVRTTMIFSNYCKVQNQSSANLVCQFYEKQSVKIAGGQCASIHMRHHFSTNQLSEEPPPTVSVQLAFLRSFTTSPIQLSLTETQVFAWKTRIISNDDSRTFPGPFIVVDITRKSEDGLSIAVSPLIRVHNETDFSIELRFRRPKQAGDEFALVSLKKGETLDDSMAMLEAISSSGGMKKAITSLGVGNFLLSFRPEIPESNVDDARSSVGWSDDIKGGKAVYLSGVLDKLNYKVRKALSSESTKISFTTACCTIGTSNSLMGELHFLIKICTKGVPIKQPDKPRGNEPAVALQEQKEIFLLPTFRVFNLLQSEIHVFLTDTDPVTVIQQHTVGNQATISCGSSSDFYVNPAKVFFNVSLTAYQFSCKPLNSSDWVRSLLKQKKETGFLDVDLDFGGKCFASLRLSRGSDDILEAFIFTSYTLKNETGFLLSVCQPNQKLPCRDETEKSGVDISPDIGVLLPPNSSQSWFLKSNKVQVKMLETDLCDTLLELDSLSGLSEIRLEMDDKRNFRCFTKFGIAVGPAFSKLDVPARSVTMVPRYVVLNNSEENVIVRQCYLEDDTTGMLTIKSKQREMLMLREISGQTEFSLFENLIRKHRNTSEDSTIYIQFQSDNSESDWSGPICVASLGCFFLKFRKKQSNELLASSKIATEYANVHVAEEGPSLVMRFYKPPVVKLPYRIENRLHDSLITYYQKDSSEPEVLQPQNSTDYVWDDLTLPHKLVVQISDIHQLHEINLDKIREWKSFFKSQRYEGLSSQVLTKRKSGSKRNSMAGFEDIMKVGYEVYADGPTRVLCISEASGARKEGKTSSLRVKIRIRVPGLALHMTELKEGAEGEPSVYTPFLISRLAHVNVDALFTDQQNYCNISVQSLDVVPKWAGAPFAAVVRRHHSESDDSTDCILKIVIVFRSSSSKVKQFQYSSIVLQPIDLNLDEETLMKIVPFWRTSLSESSTPSQQFYFDHFEIHPIKIFANFVPGDSYSSYSSAQETLRSFIHSVIKIPPMKNMVVELNGVLVTHALVTMRELSIKCAQHYTWYAMRAIYIAKGSPLLPPGFASIFDDLASSSLDVFFDPSKALMKLPGLTLGTFKLISKSIGGKDFSGTKRYFGDLEKTLRTAGSNVMFAAVTEISDSVLRGAETSGFDGMIRGFHQGILKLAMEPSVLGSALLEGGPDRVIKLDESPGMDEYYIEGYLQAMLDAIFKQEYLTVRVVDDQVFLKNLPPNSTIMEEIMDRVKGVLISRGLLKGDPLAGSRSLRHLRGDNSEWRIGPTVITLCEHLVVSFAIRMLRNQATKATYKIKRNLTTKGDDEKEDERELSVSQSKLGRFIWRWGIGRFVLSGLVAYVDGRLCRNIPHPIARRIVSGFLLSFIDNDDKK